MEEEEYLGAEAAQKPDYALSEEQLLCLRSIPQLHPML